MSVAASLAPVATSEHGIFQCLSGIGKGFVHARTPRAPNGFMFVALIPLALID